MTRGHAAAIPPPDWRPPERKTAGGRVVIFVAEDGSSTRAFDFRPWPVSESLQVAFADAFATLTAPDGTHRSIHTATRNFSMLKSFAQRLAGQVRPPVTPADITAAHLASLRLARTEDYVRVKIMLRAMTGTTASLQASLRTADPPRRSEKLQSYSKDEFAAIMAAARRDIRKATMRIRTNRDLLTRYLDGELCESGVEWDRARIVGHLAEHGDVPRLTDGKGVEAWVRRQGTITQLCHALFLTKDELVAGAALLIGLTGQNAGGVDQLTVEHRRADGDGSTAATRVAIVDVVKPRRGRRRRYMTVPLADVPGWLGGSPEEQQPSPQNDLLTPFGVYARLCELTADARALTGSNRLFIGYAGKGGSGVGKHWQFGFVSSGGSGTVWASKHGLLTGSRGEEQAPLSLTWPRLRLTYVQLHQRAVAHTDRVLFNEYLLRDRGNIADYQQLVAKVLAEQEFRAREFGVVKRLSAADIEQFREDPETVSNRMGISCERLEQLIAGGLDTVLAGCINVHDSPLSEPGELCQASFFMCLGCSNARATPDHLPAQAQAHHRLLELREEMTPRRWAERLSLPEAQLRHLLAQHSSMQVDDALADVDPMTVALIDRLLAGELDVR